MGAAGLSDPKLVANTVRGSAVTRCWVLCASFVKADVFFLLQVQKKINLMHKTIYQTCRVEKEYKGQAAGWALNMLSECKRAAV